MACSRWERLVQQLKNNAIIPKAAGTGAEYKSLGGVPMYKRRCPALGDETHLESSVQDNGRHTSITLVNVGIGKKEKEEAWEHQNLDD